MITEQAIDDFFNDDFLSLSMYEFYGNSSRRNRESYNVLRGYEIDDKRTGISTIIMIIERDDYYDVVFNNIVKSFKIDKQNKWYDNIIHYILSYHVEKKMKK